VTFVGAGLYYALLGCIVYACEGNATPSLVDSGPAGTIFVVKNLLVCPLILRALTDALCDCLLAGTGCFARVRALSAYPPFIGVSPRVEGWRVAIMLLAKTYFRSACSAYFVESIACYIKCAVSSEESRIVTVHRATAPNASVAPDTLDTPALGAFCLPRERDSPPFVLLQRQEGANSGRPQAFHVRDKRTLSGNPRVCAFGRAYAVAVLVALSLGVFLPTSLPIVLMRVVPFLLFLGLDVSMSPNWNAAVYFAVLTVWRFALW
jgi:hypothetical protein